MDIGFDHMTVAAASLSGRGGDAKGQPDWTGLRARLFAARAAHLALAAGAPARIALPQGSFDGESARRIASFAGRPEHGLDLVNPTDSSDRNPEGATTAAVVGTSKTGDRG